MRKYFLLLVVLNTILLGCSKDKISTPDTSNQVFTNFDNAILSKMNLYNAPSISIAIVKNEKLVYLKSYGKSDIEANTTASNDDLYRIASVSKPITVIAILKLVQDGLVSLDQKVFGSGAILGNDFGAVPQGSKKDLITVRHLLDHKSGWTNVPDDPMFRANNITQKQLITDLLANRNLSTNPGSTYYYSNFGYCILGRVIEKITGLTYEEYVKNKILTPCNIYNMKIGGSTLTERSVNEVKYYQSEFSPYIMNIARFDSHGGWIASSKDLARLMVKIDRNTIRPDIISANLLNQFYFGYTNWVHFGSIPGTSSILQRIDNNLSYVMLTNTRTNNDASIILNDLNNTIKSEISAITQWPTTDLF